MNEKLTDGLQPGQKPVLISEGEALVIECDSHLSMEQLARMKEHIERTVEPGIGRKVLILQKGMRVSNDEQLRRIEAKLDELLEARK